MKILYKLASRSRPVNFFRTLDNIFGLSAIADFRILASLDKDDSAFNYIHIDKIKYYQIAVKWGESKNKIDAVNRDINDLDYDWDILVNTSDDMLFTVPAFDQEIINDMKNNFPDTDGFLHYNDGNQKSNVCTLSIMGRKYYDRFKYIYHPDYVSLWSDVEATEVAYMLGKYKYMGDEKIIFNHLHPSFGKAAYDEQYRKSESQEFWDQDYRTILRRRENKYGLKESEIVNGFKYDNI